jgi:hypothetical protein
MNKTVNSAADRRAAAAWKKQWGRAWAKARRESRRPIGCRCEISFVVPADPHRIIAQAKENDVAAHFGREPRQRLYVLPPVSDSENVGEGNAGKGASILEYQYD